jgi:hypothetical protein
MTDFVNPTAWVDFGDAVGATHLAVAKTIGGGASDTPDAFDETTALIDNSTHGYTKSARNAVFELALYGEESPGAAIDTETSPSYVEFARMPIKMAADRDTLTVTFDHEQGTVKVELFTSGAASRGSGASTEKTTRTQTDVSVTSSTVADTAYAVLSHKAKTGKTGKVYMVRGYEDATSL